MCCGLTLLPANPPRWIKGADGGQADVGCLGVGSKCCAGKHCKKAATKNKTRHPKGTLSKCRVAVRTPQEPQRTERWNCPPSYGLQSVFVLGRLYYCYLQLCYCCFAASCVRKVMTTSRWGRFASRQSRRFNRLSFWTCFREAQSWRVYCVRLVCCTRRVQSNVELTASYGFVVIANVLEGSVFSRRGRM